MSTSSTPLAIGITGVGQIAINVHDLDRAVTFYRESLGLPLLFNTGTLCFFYCGGIRLMLSRAEKPEFDHRSSTLYFTVPKIEETYQHLSAKGVRFEDKPHMIARLPQSELWMAFFRDSEDNLMALMSEVTPG